MAEFQEVMKNYERMCKEHLCNDACPMYKIGVCEKIGRCITEYGIEKVEQIVMEWAAEHPEPVYPTWREYLMDLILPNSPSGNFATFLLEQYIPADIAQKLGIEPKEV